MSEHKHAVDAHVPSDSEEFEKKAAETGPQSIPEDMQTQLKRVQQFAMFYAQNEKDGFGPMTMLMEMYCQMCVMHATISALNDVVLPKLGVPYEKIMTGITKHLEERMTIAQMEHKLLITPLGVKPFNNPTEMRKNGRNQKGD